MPVLMLKKQFNYIIYLFRDRVSLYSQLASNLPLFPPHPPECWDYRYAPPCMVKFFFSAGMEPRGLHMLGNYSTTELHPQTFELFLMHEEFDINQVQL
jgi:hypothetical protein